MSKEKQCDKIVMASFLRSTDGGVNWHFIMASDVPDWLKNNDALMKEIIENNAMASNPEIGDKNWYQAMVPDKSNRQTVLH